MMQKIKKILIQNVVTIVFVALCIGGIIASEQPLPFIVKELITRIGRNSFLVLALIVPVIAGMGLNFGIVIGAMAAQIVRQLLDNKFNRISHLRFLHLQGARQMGFTCLIRMRIYPERDCEVTDSG